MSSTGEFLLGVIEGFYGQPWSEAERVELFDWMRNWRLNSYLYAPKDDLKHRALWRFYVFVAPEALPREAALARAAQGIFGHITERVDDPRVSSPKSEA